VKKLAVICDKMGLKNGCIMGAGYRGGLRVMGGLRVITGSEKAISPAQVGG